MRKKTIIYIRIVAFIIIAIVSYCLSTISLKTSERLSVTQISKLRSEYPLITNDAITLEYPLFGLDIRLSVMPILAEVEVLEYLPDYTVEIVNKIDEKDITSKLLFHQYKLKINSILLNQTGFGNSETVTICFADSFKASYPSLKIGSKYIISLEAAKGAHEEKYLFFDNTAYYITNDDYVISVYEEPENNYYSGMAKSEFIKIISELSKKTVKE